MFQSIFKGEGPGHPFRGNQWTKNRGAAGNQSETGPQADLDFFSKASRSDIEARMAKVGVTVAPHIDWADNQVGFSTIAPNQSTITPPEYDDDQNKVRVVLGAMEAERKYMESLGIPTEGENAVKVGFYDYRGTQSQASSILGMDLRNIRGGGKPPDYNVTREMIFNVNQIGVVPFLRDASNEPDWTVANQELIRGMGDEPVNLMTGDGLPRARKEVVKALGTIFRHELGHSITTPEMFLAAGYFMRIKGRKFIESKVSKYAAINQQEFIAETFAMYTSRTFGPKNMDRDVAEFGRRLVEVAKRKNPFDRDSSSKYLMAPYLNQPLGSKVLPTTKTMRLHVAPPVKGWEVVSTFYEVGQPVRSGGDKDIEDQGLMYRRIGEHVLYTAEEYARATEGQRPSNTKEDVGFFD